MERRNDCSLLEMETPHTDFPTIIITSLFELLAVLLLDFLDGHNVPQAGVSHFSHLAHAALADFLRNPVVRNHLADPVHVILQAEVGYVLLL